MLPDHSGGPILPPSLHGVWPITIATLPQPGQPAVSTASWIKVFYAFLWSVGGGGTVGNWLFFLVFVKRDHCPEAELSLIVCPLAGGSFGRHEQGTI